MNIQLHRFPFSLIKKLPGVLPVTGEGEQSIYLTFDDGPDEQRTPEVLDILQKENEKATFFCLGEQVRKNPDLFKRIQAEGHAIGNHGYYHLDGWNTPFETYVNNVAEADEYIGSPLFRPPYGHVSLRQFQALKKKYWFVFWDVMAWDFDQRRSPEESLAILKRHTRPGRIVVLHDYKRSEVSLFLEEYLRYCRERGYQFRPLTIPN